MIQGPGYLVAKTVMWRFVWWKICEKSCDIFLWRGITKNVTKNLCVQRTYFDDLGSIHCVRKTSQKMSQKTSQQILTENIIENLTKNVTSQFWKIIPRPQVSKNRFAKMLDALSHEIICETYSIICNYFCKVIVSLADRKITLTKMSLEFS